jgi:hypothetical protein
VLVIAARLVLAVALIYAATVVAIAHAGGPLALDLGPLHASASNMPKAALLSITALVVSLLLGTLARRGEHGPPPMAFYVVAAVVTWSLTLGPSIIVMGSERGVAGPFSWLLTLPGTDALRVPARFWLMTVLCLAVTGGCVVAELVARRRQAVAVAAAVLIGAAVFSDGAVNALVSTPMPRPLPDARVLAGGHVLFLPIGQQRFDIPFTYQAVVGRFSAVNGYSGYEPSYYPALVAATRMEDPALFQPLRRYGPLDVVVVNDAPRLRALIEDVPGARELARDDAVTEYRLPAAPAAYAVASGRIVPIRRLHADCGTGTESRAVDGSLQSAWLCPQIENAAFTIDLGQPAVVGAVVTQMGPWVTGYPRELTVETSLDGERWEAGWSGRALAPLVWSALAQPPIVPMTFAFAPRQARFVRLTQTGRDTLDPWANAEVQVRAP